jgi:hypothetical protein
MQKAELEQEQRRLKHEVDMCQETIWHDKRHGNTSASGRLAATAHAGGTADHGSPEELYAQSR